MTEPDQQPITPAEQILIQALCQWNNPFPGPRAWFCRFAWVAASCHIDFDVDQLIAQRGDWLNRPENADTRTSLVACMDWLRRMAAKPPLWPLPDEAAFDASQWLRTGHGSYAIAEGTQPNDGKTPHNPRWTLSGPGRYELIGVDHGRTITTYTYLRSDPEPRSPRLPAKWDGRPTPGKCTIDGCPYQATSMYGYWDGGAPGKGTWRQHGRCPQHQTGTELAELRTELEP